MQVNYITEAIGPLTRRGVIDAASEIAP